MATKAELEAENTELKAKIAALEAAATPVAVSVGTAVELKPVVPLDDLADAASEINSLRDEVASLKKLQKNVAPVVPADKDVVYVSGVPYDVVWRNTVKETAIESSRRNIDPEATCFVIARTGQ